VEKVTTAASANKSRELRRRAKRYGAYHLQAGTIGAACDRFLKDRGLLGTREYFNKSFRTEEPKTDELEIP
jgi:hypothetical protein